jgi:hypothetical protein
MHLWRQRQYLINFSSWLDMHKRKSSKPRKNSSSQDSVTADMTFIIRRILDMTFIVLITQ